MRDCLKDYCFELSDAEVLQAIDTILAGASGKASEKVYKECFSFMDLTTLKGEDTPSGVKAFVEKVGRIGKQFPSYPLPASICVYPNFASIVRDNRCSPELHVTCVSGAFPSAQSFLDVKVAECGLAVEQGADEIDVVLPLNAFLDGDYDRAFGEIAAMRSAVDKAASGQGRKAVLKVILETGLLDSAELIARASFLAMEAGADFIKTSTGKVAVNATPQAAYVMCRCIREYYEKTGRKVGFKAAGGISNAGDALGYYCIVLSVLGEGWLDRDGFRLGVSRLGNDLMSAIEQKTVKFF